MSNVRPDPDSSDSLSSRIATTMFADNESSKKWRSLGARARFLVVAGGILLAALLLTGPLLLHWVLIGVVAGFGIVLSYLAIFTGSDKGQIASAALIVVAVGFSGFWPEKVPFWMVLANGAVGFCVAIGAGVIASTWYFRQLSKD